MLWTKEAIPLLNQSVLTLSSTHHQAWTFGRFSYLETPRPDHGLLLLLSGGIDYISQDQVLHLGPMELVYLPQGSRYEARFHPGTEDLLINFHILGGDAPLPSTPQFVTHDPGRTLLPLMEQTVRSFHGEHHLEATGQFYLFCHHLTGLLQASQDGPNLIDRAKALLGQPDCSSVEAVAKQLLISPSGLRKKFRDAEGISPAQYRLQQKLEQAKRQLLSTDLPVSVVAENCGFYDSAYFHRVFCRREGLTPGAYRATNKQL